MQVNTTMPKGAPSAVMQVNTTMPKGIFAGLNSEDPFKLQDEDSLSTSASSEGGSGGSGCDTSCCAGQGVCKSPSFFSRDPVLQIEPPPGLPLPAEVLRPTKSYCGFRPPPGLEAPSHLPVVREYTVQGFRREANKILKELKLHKNVSLAVSQVRKQGVPLHRQAAEFADLLTMALEETRGPARRVCVAFISGLTKAFAVPQCIAGFETFFLEIYEDLRIEVPDLSKRIASELLPTLKSVLDVDDFERVAALQVRCFSFKRREQ
jgi:hypothetical protein